MIEEIKKLQDHSEDKFSPITFNSSIFRGGGGGVVGEEGRRVCPRNRTHLGSYVTGRACVGWQDAWVGTVLC